MTVRGVAWRAGVTLAALALTACQHQGTGSAGTVVGGNAGSPQPYVLGSGGDVLRFIPAAAPPGLKVSEAEARATVERFARQDSDLYRQARLVSLAFGAITGSAAVGADVGQRVWVARYLVPFADIPVDSCPRLLPTPLPTPTRGDAAIIVNAVTGKPDSWNVDRRERCAP